jgi:K+/H+ antiporter YhaU regulatory subunit KhtT
VDAWVWQKLGVIIVAIRRAEGTMGFHPAPDATIRAGDETWCSAGRRA